MKTTAAVRPGLRLALAALLAATAACAPKAPDLPAGGGVNKYPRFHFPRRAGRHGDARRAGTAQGRMALASGRRSSRRRTQLRYDIEARSGVLPGRGRARLRGARAKESSGAVTHFDNAVVMNPRLRSGTRRARRGAARAGRSRSGAQKLRGRGGRPTPTCPRSAAASRSSGSEGCRTTSRERGRPRRAAIWTRPARPISGRSQRRRRARSSCASSRWSSVARTIFPRAVELVQKAIELEPTDARTLMVLGELYEAQGETGQGHRGLRTCRRGLVRADRRDRETDRRAARKAAARGPSRRVPRDSKRARVSRADLAALFGVWLDDSIKTLAPTESGRHHRHPRALGGPLDSRS